MDPTLARKYLASPLAKFRPWVGTDGYSPQQDFLQSAATNRVRIMRAGNQTGKTTIAVVDALLRLLGYHPWVKHKPPIYGWLVALDWEWGVGQVLWPRMREYLPMDQVRSILWYRRAEPSLPQSIIFKNGSQLDFKSADSGRRKFQGAALHFVGIDEEQPADIMEECRARLVKRGGHFWATLTPVRRERWVLDLEQLPQTRLIRASMTEAANVGILEDEAVRGYLDSLSDRQRQVREFGDFAALEGLVYPDFHRTTHVIRPSNGRLRDYDGNDLYPWPLPSNWKRFAAIDFGYVNPTSVVIMARDAVNDIYIVEKVLYSSDIRITVWAEILKEEVPPLAIYMVSDHDTMEREELRARGWNTTPAFKEIVPGLEAVERRLQPRKKTHGRPGIYFVVDDENPPRNFMTGRTDAHFLCWEMESYRYPEPVDGRPSPRDLPIKKDDHACDALRYLVYYLDGIGTAHPSPGKPKPKSYGPLEQYWAGNDMRLGRRYDPRRMDLALRHEDEDQ